MTDVLQRMIISRSPDPYMHYIYEGWCHGIHYLCLNAASTNASCLANHTPKPGLFSHLS